jgi:hypothetical protein
MNLTDRLTRQVDFALHNDFPVLRTTLVRNKRYIKFPSQCCVHGLMMLRNHCLRYTGNHVVVA